MDDGQMELLIGAIDRLTTAVNDIWFRALGTFLLASLVVGVLAKCSGG